eukprot:CAMPEP_0177786974 /NCGR_PEP_ID=MMETSP0491_2-20121128/21218_1 /TAXON_ID=63592 /ORGANISM="Tetraselmis chuii, Strain PLY429" /LENGTH=905 /DNA_ID=CAMNT_0019308239 /DNA_START=168 /DNA_END=2886 /DNA_ORIENTATION=-
MSDSALPDSGSLGASGPEVETIIKIAPVLKSPIKAPELATEEVFEKSLSILGSSPPGEDAGKGAALLQRSRSGIMKTRQILNELHNSTHFGVTELESLLSHFSVVAGNNRMISRRKFKVLWGTKLLEHIFTGVDDTDDGYINFSQFAMLLSIIFRGDNDEIIDFWFKMYDKDHDGLITKAEFDELLHDVAAGSKEELNAAADATFLEYSVDDVLGHGVQYIDFQAFKQLVTDTNVLPSFYEPHQQAPDHQQFAFRDLKAREREVLALLGAEHTLPDGYVLIHEEQPTARYFFFIMSGEVELKRSGIHLATQREGTFLGEAALFDDVKAVREDGSIKFTTTVVSKGPVRILQMEIGSFYPLVYQEHPGSTAIVQRLGRVMMDRFQQTEERLQSLLAVSQKQSEAGMRLSSKDWSAFRKRLMRLWALRYHKIGRKGKLEIAPTKLMGTAADLSVAYSPGVAEPCLSIHKDPKWAYEYTAKGHLVGVVTNGTAVLGLGNIGPLAAKPVMEGKAVLFKKFADLDSFDIEVDMPDPVKFVDLVCALEPTFGGINLEDIKAPECFYVEKECQRRCSIPVFHDDQHGTAIIAGAGLLNALDLVVKEISQIKVVVCGCGAAGFTCAKYFLSLGVQRKNLICIDVKGVVYAGREDLNEDNYLTEVASQTEKRTLTEALEGADVFLGLSAGGLLKPDMLITMKRDPIVFALANPIPEIDYELAKSVRPDVIMATGRSDLPNQINNVCAFPFIFRGALDCRASSVNEAMKLAATQAIAKLARTPKLKKPDSYLDLSALSHFRGSSNVAGSSGSSPRPGNMFPHHAHHHRSASGTSNGSFSSSISGLARRESVKLQVTPDFGPEYIIPKPFDDRLLVEVTSAVAKAAISTGVSKLEDFDLLEYRNKLQDLADRLQIT